MTEEYDILTDGRNISEAASEWESSIDFSKNSNTYGLVRALLAETERIDDDIEDIYEQQHINSATGEELEQFGALVNVDRQTGESDDRYRARIKASFRASTMGTTYDQFAEFCSTVLNTDIQNINFRTNYEARPGIINVGTAPSVYDDLDLTNEEVRDVLGSGVPAGHEVRVLEGGTFRLKEDGQVDDPDKGLTSDAIESGGTLAADLL
jgi:uncharacterized protein YciU (UPF0263 family)